MGYDIYVKDKNNGEILLMRNPAFIRGSNITVDEHMRQIMSSKLSIMNQI